MREDWQWIRTLWYHGPILRFTVILAGTSLCLSLCVLVMTIFFAIGFWSVEGFVQVVFQILKADTIILLASMTLIFIWHALGGK